MKKFTAIDIFAGCGGFSYGFQEEGFDILLGIDNDETALKTFENNHDNAQATVLDMHKKESIEDIEKILGGRHLNAIIAGPPCQGFSLTGTRNEADERNSLFHSVFDLARKLSPEAIVIENVTGILSLYNGKIKNKIFSLCDELGYNCQHAILYAPDYGVPQIRKRVFFIALKKELGDFEFPKPLFDEPSYITCEMAIGDLPSLKNETGYDAMQYGTLPTSEYQKSMRKKQKLLYNHIATKHTEHVINVISQVPEGGDHRDLPPGVGDSRKFNEAWTRYHSKKPSKTIDTGHRNHFHYKWNRVPTIRENARLQSFPDSFVFSGNKTQQNKQVGNAVPPILGKVVANRLREYLC